MMNMNELPKGWKWIKLENLAKVIVGGGTPSTTIEEYWDGDVPWISSADILGIRSVQVRKKITRKAIENSTTNILPKGGIIIVTRVGLGKIAIAPFDICFSQDSQGVLLDDKIITEDYALQCLSVAVQGFKASSRGTTLNGVTKKQLLNLEIPVPPLPEQHRIVAKIEALFSQLDNGIAQLKTAQAQLKVYRQAVLKWAFEGRLTNGDKEWRQLKLSEIANAIDPQPSHRTPPKVDGGIPFVSIKDFDSELDKIDFLNARKVAPTVLEEHLERYRLQLGDFVIGKIGTIGKPVRMVLPQDYALSANIVLIQPRKVNPTYLYYFFQSSIIEKALLEGTRATTQSAFGIQKVRELLVNLPIEEEQHRIVQEVESRLSVCDKLEETITQALQQSEALRQSILKRAFEGRLVK